MGAFSHRELDEAFRHYWGTGAVGEDWSAWADLFTEDVEYVEHFLGRMRGREAVRAWILPLMREYPELYTAYQWHTVDEARGRVIFAMINRRDHPGGGPSIDFPGISVIDYAGAGLWKRQEDYWAAPAGRSAYQGYREALCNDPEHPAKQTRKEWGDGPEWCQGAPLGPTSTLVPEA